ncbi:MAG: glycosyltransferase family 4 protein [Terriglobia bacterium]|nr:glycosyltransferase family 4 protein [Terriglobia bacterium]
MFRLIGGELRILFAISTLGRGGAERVASILCNAWAARGHEVVLVQTYSQGPVTAYELAPAIRHLSLTNSGSADGTSGTIMRMATFRNIVKSERPDVIVSFMSHVNVFVMISTLFLKIPRILAERSDPIFNPIPFGLRFACRFFYPLAELVVMQTEEQTERIVEAFGSIPRTMVIPNPLPRDLPSPRQNQFGRDRKILISLGRLSQEKRVDVVIEAFSQVAGQARDWDLHIYGDGPCRAMLQAQAKRSPFCDRIIFKGYSDQAYNTFSEADLFIMTSDYEGFPNALLEAMALGLAVVSSDCPCGAKEITRNGEDGLLVQVGDMAALSEALLRMMNDGAARTELGWRASQSVRNRFALEKVMTLWNEALLTARASK